MESAAAYINQANEVRKGFNSWFQVTIESVKKIKDEEEKQILQELF